MITLIGRTVIEKILRQLLHLDHASLKNLQRYNGKIIALDISDFHLKTYIFFVENKILLQNFYDGEVDTLIKGTLFSFIQQMTQQPSLKQAIMIEGDVELAQALQKLIKNFNFDWEEYLSYMTGDIIAHKIKNLFNSVSNKTQQISRKFSMTLKEYLQEESLFLPSREEFEDFCTDLNNLKHDIDRLAARYQRIPA